MLNLSPSMRLKVKRDTFFLPDSETSVYFRNNKNSFRMEGRSIVQWVEKLLPMFNGEHTLQVLTEGLPSPYQKQVFDIASVLYQNEFVRDVSKDQVDQLSTQIKEKYASQIEFLNHFGDSGAFRFQRYREMKILAIGSGSMFISLISSLLETGASSIHLFVTDEQATNEERLTHLINNAQQDDSELNVKKINAKAERQQIEDVINTSYDAVLYVSQQENKEELIKLSNACEENRLLFIPAIALQRYGVAGPIAKKGTKGCVASAWRRLHQSVVGELQDDQRYGNVGSAMLANLICFELFKEVTGVRDQAMDNHCYLLNLETLEGIWHPFYPHPLEDGEISVTEVKLLELLSKGEMAVPKEGNWFQICAQLTSDTMGIFHKWEEGDLTQLPISQCSVQTVDALSVGPAELLPPIICGALTHEGARREAGFSGIEAYVQSAASELFDSKKYSNLVIEDEYVGIGTGETNAECIARGLQKCLDERLQLQLQNGQQTVKWLEKEVVGDEYCQYLIQSIQSMNKTIKIGLGDHLYGFPVVFVKVNDRLFAGTGVQLTQALCQALQKLTLHLQNNVVEEHKQSVIHEQQQSIPNLIVPTFDSKAFLDHVHIARDVLQQQRMEMVILDIQFEKVFHNELAGLYGVVLREKVSR